MQGVSPLPTTVLHELVGPPSTTMQHGGVPAPVFAGVLAIGFPLLVTTGTCW